LSKLYVLKGLPASGKSTAAAEMAKTGNVKRINFDLMREMLDHGKWSKINEKFLHEASIMLAELAAKHGYSVVMDNTNLSKSQLGLCESIKSKIGLDMEVIDFTSVDPEECCRRDSERHKPVGRDVIYGMYNTYLRNNVFAKYDASLPDCIIVDLDGTIADHGNERSAFDGESVDKDKVREPVKMAIHGFMSQGVFPVFVSGRENKGKCLVKTAQWLREKAAMPDKFLFMRAGGDHRKDYIIKREIYEKEIAGKFNVLGVFDDRAQVIRECWDKLGFGDRIFRMGRIDADNF